MGFQTFYGTLNKTPNSLCDAWLSYCWFSPSLKPSCPFVWQTQGRGRVYYFVFLAWVICGFCSWLSLKLEPLGSNDLDWTHVTDFCTSSLSASVSLKWMIQSNSIVVVLEEHAFRVLYLTCPSLLRLYGGSSTLSYWWFLSLSWQKNHLPLENAESSLVMKVTIDLSRWEDPLQKHKLASHQVYHWVHRRGGPKSPWGIKVSTS